MKKIFLILTTIFLIGCNKEDDIIVYDSLIESYHMWYMDYPSLTFSFPNPDDILIKLEYSNNKISRRIGDIVFNPSGKETFFANHIYDELSYGNGKIVIEKKSSEYNVHPHKRIINLNNDGNIVKKTLHKLGESGLNTHIDTITTEYTYDSKKLLIETYRTKKINYSRSNNNLIYYENALFYYNENKNLDSIITIRYSYNNFNDDYEFLKKIVETFSNYDESKNLTKNLNIFEETFKRSLSKNNFKTYRKDVYYGTPLILNYSEGQTWDYIYDSEGNIRFDK